MTQIAKKKRIANALISLSVIALTANIANADESLNAAVDAYLDDDFSQMATIQLYAEQGDPMAMGVLGQALWFGIGLEKNRTEGLKYLKSAGENGDTPSAAHLGRLYAVGYPQAPKSPFMSARWFVIAADGGDPSAPGRLQNMPRETVIAAGGAKWLEPEAASNVAPVPRPTATPTPTPTPTPELQFPPPKQVSKPETSTPAANSDLSSLSPGDLANQMTALIFGDQAPYAPPYVLRDGSSFNILTDSRFSTAGDIAASCAVIMNDVMEDQSNELQQYNEEAKSGNRQNAERAKTLAQALDFNLAAFQTATNVLSDSGRNGGLNEDQANAAYRLHRIALAARPDDAPSLEDCQSRMYTVLTDVTVSELAGRYWNR